MYYFIYETTNEVNGMIYTGVHKTKNLNDGYLGSGKDFIKAVKKYGKENFTRTIIEFCLSEELMYKREKEIVNKAYVLQENNYNKAIGGKGGGLTLEDQKKGWIAHNVAMELKFGKDYQNHINNLAYAALEKKYGTEWAKIISKKGWEKLNLLYPKGLWFGKKHKEESKKRIGEKSAIHQIGEGNSQYGTMWITDGVINKKIKKGQLIPSGFKKGRKL
jgi:hypothetical protein